MSNTSWFLVMGLTCMLSSPPVHAADTDPAEAPQAQAGVLLYLTAEAERLQVRRNYLAEFAKILPGRTVARFYQVENKMDAVLRYDLAATIPVVDEKRGTPAK